MRGAAGVLTALALAGATGCATSSSSPTESGEALSCDASMYILDGGCVDFPEFSDARLPAGDATGDDTGGDSAEGSARGDGATSPATKATSYLANPAHTNAIADPSLLPPLAQRWSRNYVGYTVVDPLIADGAVYLLLRAAASGAAHQVVALDEHSGATLWGPVTVDGVYVEGAAYDSGRVYVLSSSPDEAQAFDARTGAVLWRAPMSSSSNQGGGAPTAYDGVLYVAGSSAVFALDEISGKELWSAQTSLAPGGSPAVTDDGVYVGGPCAETYAFDRTTGRELWHHAPPCGGGAGGTTMVYARRVYVDPGDNGAMVVLDALTGDVLSSRSLPTLASFDQGAAFFTTSQALHGSSLSGAQADWVFAGDMGVYSIPFVAGGTVYVPSLTGQLLGVDETSGSQSWSTSAPLGDGPPVVGAEGVLVAIAYNDDGILAYEHVDLPDASVAIGDGGVPTPIVLASGGSGQGLALDAVNVYWTDGSHGSVWKVAKDGGASSLLYSSSSAEPWTVAVDSTSVYWTAPNYFFGGTDSGVMSVPLDGGTPTTLAAAFEPAVLAASGGHLYWTTSGTATIESLSLDGGTVATLVTDPNGASDLTVDSRNLYFCNPAGVYQQPLGGGTPLSIGGPAAAISADGTDVYYVTSGGEVGRVPIDGGSATTLATGRIGTLVAVAVDDRNVYWIEGEGTIMQGAVAALPKSGGRVAVLASGLSDPLALAVDEGGIYFTNPAGGGLVEKIAK